MTLFLFNPEHDISLALNTSRYTLPAIVQCFSEDLAFLPALYARPGDAVLVPNRVVAKEALRHFVLQLDEIGAILSQANEITFIEARELFKINVKSVDVWGWDIAVRDKLLSYGIEKEILPSSERIEILRNFSNRGKWVSLYNLFADLKGTVGGAFRCKDFENVVSLLARYGNIMVKSPWSGSGRGVRHLIKTPSCSDSGWIKNVLKIQGSITVEPYYSKELDFAMEFFVKNNTPITYYGLSIFNVEDKTYAGGIIASEDWKEDKVTQFVSRSLLYEVKDRLCKYLERECDGVYEGPVGVDMMIVRLDDLGKYALHPCVEVNLRRTMGHVALALSKQQLPSCCAEMKVKHTEGKIRLTVNRL